GRAVRARPDRRQPLPAARHGRVRARVAGRGRGPGRRGSRGDRPHDGPPRAGGPAGRRGAGSPPRAALVLARPRVPASRARRDPRLGAPQRAGVRRERAGGRTRRLVLHGRHGAGAERAHRGATAGGGARRLADVRPAGRSLDRPLGPARRAPLRPRADRPVVVQLRLHPRPARARGSGDRPGPSLRRVARNRPGALSGVAGAPVARRAAGARAGGGAQGRRRRHRRAARRDAPHGRRSRRARPPLRPAVARRGARGRLHRPGERPCGSLGRRRRAALPRQMGRAVGSRAARGDGRRAPRRGDGHGRLGGVPARRGELPARRARRPRGAPGGGGAPARRSGAARAACRGRAGDRGTLHGGRVGRADRDARRARGGRL
ncbi:MAG: hypothetical protein AVDCRST_MAG53-1231, partial [uncultured Solirubrobacteraceae bacterium]